MKLLKYKNSNLLQAGFTLIELLVVIAIVGLLASVVLVSLNSAREKSRDTKRKADLAQLQKAIEIYYDRTGQMPINRNPCCYYGDNEAGFLDELVTSGIISRVPKDPQSPARVYYYYNYGNDPCAGYFLITDLEGDKSKNPNMSALATCPTSWNAVKNGSCLPGSSYCVYGRN